MERAELTETQQGMNPSATEFPTEALLESAQDLDQLPTSEVLRLIHEEDARAHAAVGRVMPAVEEAVDVLVLPRVVPEWALANQSELDVKEPPSELAPSKHAMRRRPAGKLRALIPAAPPSHGVHADPEHAAAEEQAAAAAAKAAKAEDDAAAKAARASKRRARKELSKKGAKVATEEERVGWQEMPEAIPKRFAAKHSPRKTKSSTSASYSGRTPLTLHPHPDSRAPREHAVFVSYRQ